jgi:prepilin signal peptidase PulO-like enzyme (type II secretory pathway)
MTARARRGLVGGWSLVPETTLAVLRAVLFLLCAAPITLVDLRSARIPDVYSLGGLVFLALFDALFEPGALPWDCLSAVLVSGLFLGVRSFVGGLGLGDVKYAALVAFYAGLPWCFAAMAAAAMAALLFLATAVAFRGGRRSMMLPFAPFLTLGALVAAALDLALGGGR